MRRKIGILADPHGGYQRDTIVGLSKYAESIGSWELQHRVLRKGGLQRLMQWEPDAVVGVMEPAECHAALRNTGGIGVSLYTPSSTNHDVYTVTPDPKQIAERLVNFVQSKGFRSLVFLHAEDRPWTDAVLRELPITNESTPELAIEAVPCGKSEKAWRKKIHRFLSHAAFPMAIVAEPELARDCCHASQDLGIAVPEQVSICSLDDNELICGLARPAISALQLPGMLAARVIGDLLSQHFRGEAPVQQHWYLPVGQIIERRSTDITAIDDPLVAQAMQLIHERTDQRLQVQDLLRALGVSRRHLEKRFAASLGQSPHGAITSSRITAAKRRLLQSTLPLATIAAQCGYHDPCQFSRDFKRATGVAPGIWRNQHSSG